MLVATLSSCVCDFANCRYELSILSISSISFDIFVEISFWLSIASCSFNLVNGVRRSWLIPESISDLCFKCLSILLAIRSNSYAAFLTSDAPEGLIPLTKSPLPYLSAAFAKLTIGFVWFFKKIMAIEINNNEGSVIHKINNLTDEGAIFSLGNKTWIILSLEFTLISTTSVYPTVSNQ